MASANFLEEALNTEVDESAVSALVGSLESQLVSATTCHDGPPTSNAEVEKSSANMTIGSLEQQLTRTTASSCEGSPPAAVNGGSDNSRTTPINQDSVQSSAASPAPSAGVVNQVTSSGVNQSNVLNSRGGTLRIVCPPGNVSNSGIAVQQGSLLANGGLGLLPCVQGGSDHNRTPGTIILMKAGGNQTDSTVPMTMILTGTYVNTTVGTTTTVTGSSVNTAVPTTTVSSMASGNVQLINKVPGSSMPSMVMIAKPVTSQLVCKGTGTQPSNVQLLNKSTATPNMAKSITSSGNMIVPSNVQLVNAAVASTTMSSMPGFVTLSSASSSHTNTIIPTNVQLVNSDVATTTIPSMVMIAKPVTTTGMSPGYALIPASVQQPFNPAVAASTSMSGMVTLNKPITSSTISPGYTILPSNVQSSYNASTPVSMGKPITSTGISPGYAIIPGSMSQSFNSSVTTNTETTAGITSGYTILANNAAQQPFNANVVTTSSLGKSVPSPSVSTVNSSVPVYNTGIVTTSDAASSSKPTATTSGVTPRTTYAPTVLQLVNVKGVPSGVGAQKNIPSRVIIGGQPGAITLQTLANISPGGHIIMRSESGGHILRIGTAPTVPTTTTTNTVPTAQVAQRPPTTSHKEKCQKFLSNLLELSSREPPNVQRDVRTLIQDLIDAKLEPEEFCERLERLLNASPQPCLTGFLRKNLPHLRQSLATGELVIQGIRPPNLLETLLRQQGVTSAHIIAPAPTVTSTQSNIGLVIPHTTRETSLPTQPAIVTTAVVRAPFPVKQEFGTQSLSAPASEKGPFHIKQEFSPAVPALPAVVRPPFQIKQEVIPNSSLSSAVKVVSQSKQPNVPLASTPLDSSGLSRITIATKPLFLQSSVPKPPPKIKEKKSFSSMRYAAEDDINDVAAMGGVNLAEEAQRILGSTEYVGTQIRSCKDELFLHLLPLQQKIKQICAKSGLEEPSVEVAHLISHACQERLKTLLEKVSTVAEHRIEVIKEDPQYEIYHDVKGQLKFLEELDRIEMKRHEEQEREFLLRAAKSRSKTEDPDYSRLKAKAKEMQRAEMEELRQRDANQTALQAIGPRKKLKLDTEAEGSSNGIVSRQQMRFRPRIRRITMHDLVFVLRHETPPCNSTRLLLATLQC
ncbi:transcription initiation factor TFIID subunit 4 [Anabrus simplex]|uniref:transcription initiation factor TFIID subunit 4 n=1 Tax=Anabrus simplex TaxID=316456 RepID=UPI0035A33A61